MKVKSKRKRKVIALHFVSGYEVDWKKTNALPQRKDGRFTGVVEKQS